MNKTLTTLLTGILLFPAYSFTASGTSLSPGSFDISKFRYRTESHSAFAGRNAIESQRIDSFIKGNPVDARYDTPFENPETMLTLPASDIMGDLEAPDGAIWSYIGKFEYLEIPPHDNVVFTERLLQEYTFTIYDSDMNEVGTIKDKIHYRNGEKRAPLCELTPVITRNFFNTDDELEVMVAVGINPAEGYGVHYQSYIYALGGEKDENGYDQPLMIFNSLVGDIIEGPRSSDGSDNFYFTFMGEPYVDVRANTSFWDSLTARKSTLTIFGKAKDNKGPRLIHSYSIPILQMPGDQESVPEMISLRRGNDVYFLFQQYKEPFYNRYDDPLNADLTQREGNSLLIDIFKGEEEGLTPVSHTEIPVILDTMPDAEGNPTSLFSYFSVGNLRYRQDILFDAPGVIEGKPDFIITRTNYQPSTDGMVYSYFTYRNDGTLKKTLCLYSSGSRAMGDVEGCEPQQMFVQRDSFGYRYRFVDLYSADTAALIDANYYYDEDSDPELLSANCDRTPDGNGSYYYVFELRYPLIDDDENDILRFMYLNADGSYNHTDHVNMGKGVAYAQSYLSTEALRPGTYSTSGTPAYMMLIKRGVEGSEAKIEQLMVAEAETEENPEGRTLLLLGPKNHSVLTSIVPEFAYGDRPGRLFVYYYNSPKSLLSLEIYGLPLDSDKGAVTEIKGSDVLPLSIHGETVQAEGEIHIYTIDGKLIATANDTADISNLGKGIYIVACGGKALKLVRQ